MIKRRNVILTSLVVGSAIVAAVVSCGKKDSDDSTTESNPVSTNPAALAYPTSLAITAFPQNTGTTLADTDPSGGTAKAKNAEQEKILKGEGDSCVPKVMDQKDKAPDENTCYEFDQDMVYGTMRDAKYYGTMDGKDSAKEACLVGFARSRVKDVVGHVDRSLGLAQMALCKLKKDGKAAVPEVGAEVDMKEALAAVLAKSTVTTAKMKRLADASDGAKVFTMSFDLVRPDGTPMVVNIVHSPKNAENTSYTGVINAKITRSDAGKLTADTKPTFISVVYDRSDTKMKYSLRKGQFATALADKAIGTDGQIDFNAGTAADYSYTGYTQANDAVSGMMTVAFEGNPTTNAGTFAYWQNPGGNYPERARGMLASMEYDAAAGTLSGCAVSGAAGTSSDGLSIRKAIVTGKTLEPNGSYHPFFNTEAGTCSGATTSTDATGTLYTCSATVKWYAAKGSMTGATDFVTKQMPAYHTRQCFKQASTGLYEIDTAKTTESAGYELVSATTTDTAKKVTPPSPPVPGAGVKKQ
ncbi:MAG: hypothetical protein NT027_11960 [Proteobacteria bacterium]|nr:hypothetical protein [Pseudomonadota bacterium]